MTHEEEMAKFDALQGELNKKTVEIGTKNHMLDNVIEAQEKIVVIRSESGCLYVRSLSFKA